MSEDNKNNIPNTNNFSLAIAWGCFGEFVFDNVGGEIAIGAGLGIAFSRFNSSK